ncbi:MAG: dephospho-CoA kinase [Chitinophagia bacterium]|jgi:dephospho-CoA kinase|nr:dephospho-CoA kinase [Chitinophagia bacterium]
MLKVAITGGIGSGKSLVCQVFKTLGIPIFNADAVSNQLVEHDTGLKASIIKLFGKEAYINNNYNRKYIAHIVFSQAEKLKALNELIHPKAIEAAKQWFEKQQTPYAIKEAAILFESKAEQDIDIIIGVTAPEQIRIERVMQRIGCSKDEVIKRMQQQMPEDEKMKKCNYIIHNDNVTALIPQVLQIHEKLLNFK